jgi:CBS domain-containing protein
MGTSVREAMTATARATSPSLSVREAAKLMKEEDVGSLPVVEDGRLVGVLTDRDIVVRAVAEGLDPNTARVGDAASREPIWVAPDQDLDEALRLMARHQVRRLPVVESGTLVGVVAQADVARSVKEKDAGRLVEEISQPTTAPRV